MLQLLVESWIWWSVVMLVATSRLYVLHLEVGICGIDPWIADQP